MAVFSWSAAYLRAADDDVAQVTWQPLAFNIKLAFNREKQTILNLKKATQQVNVYISINRR